MYYVYIIDKRFRKQQKQTLGELTNVEVQFNWRWIPAKAILVASIIFKNYNFLKPLTPTFSKCFIFPTGDIKMHWNLATFHTRAELNAKHFDCFQFWASEKASYLFYIVTVFNSASPTQRKQEFQFIAKLRYPWKRQKKRQSDKFFWFLRWQITYVRITNFNLTDYIF